MGGALGGRCRTLTLSDVVSQLARFHGVLDPPLTRDPFEQVLLENVAYLARPGRRRAAFELLRETVGTAPGAILSAPRADLERVSAAGILATRFAGKLRDCARIAVERFSGSLEAATSGPIGEARRALRLFPGIGAPGADRILLFSGRHAHLAPESNGLRVLVRLGLVEESRSYSTTYARAAAVASTLPHRPRYVEKAHLLLRRHGESLCRRSAPRCHDCPLARRCAWSTTHGPGPAAS